MLCSTWPSAKNPCEDDQHRKKSKKVLLLTSGHLQMFRVPSPPTHTIWQFVFWSSFRYFLFFYKNEFVGEKQGESSDSSEWHTYFAHSPLWARLNQFFHSSGGQCCGCVCCSKCKLVEMSIWSLAFVFISGQKVQWTGLGASLNQAAQLQSCAGPLLFQ